MSLDTLVHPWIPSPTQSPRWGGPEPDSGFFTCTVTHPLLGASRIFPLVAVLFPGVEKRALLELFASAFRWLLMIKSLMPLPAMGSVGFTGER